MTGVEDNFESKSMTNGDFDKSLDLEVWKHNKV